jgi:hypothetical protein
MCTEGICFKRAGEKVAEDKSLVRRLLAGFWYRFIVFDDMRGAFGGREEVLDLEFPKRCFDAWACGSCLNRVFVPAWWLGGSDEYWHWHCAKREENSISLCRFGGTNRACRMSKRKSFDNNCYSRLPFDMR